MSTMVPRLLCGNPGSGKTVTALHRAVFLARQAPGDPPSVLLTTFTRTLAEALERQLPLLTDDPEVLRAIEVGNVDRLAYRIVTEACGRQPRITDQQTLRDLWEEMAEGNPFDPVFLEREWEQVILAQDLREPEEYFAARRRGRGTPLTVRQREDVWAAIEYFTDRLQELDRYTRLQLANEVAKLAESAIGDMNT